MLRILLYLALIIISATTARADGLLSLLGTASQTTAKETDATTPPAAVAPSTAGSSWRLPTLDDLRKLANIPKVEISAEEKAALGRLKNTLWGLAGPNERFCYGDLDDIVRQLGGELGQRVDAEIDRRAAQEASKGIFPRIRGRIVARHVSRNYGSYYSQGMGIANNQVRTGLTQWLRETGCTVNVPDRASNSRQLTLAKLEGLERDAQVLRAIKERAQRLGLPGFTFPNGMGWRDIEAIENSRIPPNGKMVPNTATRASSR